VGRGVAITGFGRFSITSGGEDTTAAFSPRALRCLAHLALHGEAFDRTTLAAELWPDASERSALGSLRRRLHELEGALESVGLHAAIERTRSNVALAPATRWAIDVARYRVLACDPAQLDRAAALYEEPIFPGFDDDLLERERRRMRAAQMELLARLLEAAIRRSDPPEIADRAEAIMRLDPLSEQSVAKAVAALTALGENDRARRLLDRFKESVRQEADAEAGPLLFAAELPSDAARRILEPVVEAGDVLRGANAGRHFDEIERRMPEIREALDASIVRECDVTLGVRALAALSRFFFDRGHSVEALRWYEAALPRLSERSALRSEALYLRAIVGRNIGSTEHNLPAFEEAIGELRVAGDRTTLAKAMLYGSNAARMTGRLETARSLAAEGHAILSALEDPYLIAFACSALGTAEYALGYVESARSYLERARAGFAAVGAGDDEALMIVNVGRCTFALGELAQARELLERALGRAVASSNLYVQGHAQVGLALVALDRNDVRSARAHAARAAEISLKSSDTEIAVIALEAASELFLALEEFARARDALAAADGVRSEYLIARAPTEHARSERVRSALAQRSMLITSTVAASDVMMRSLLASVARSYHIL
jgi:DNA-binding SARP family transcriptional activator